MMPNKTIYVSDTDLPIFERAQELAGENLSSTIVQALRNFVNAHEARIAGFREIVVRVGSGVYTRKQFRGRLLAKGHTETPDTQAGTDETEFGPHGEPELDYFEGPWGPFGKQKRGPRRPRRPGYPPFGPMDEGRQTHHKILEVYQTAKQRIALYTRELPDWWPGPQGKRRWERDWWRWERDWERMVEHLGWAAGGQWGNWNGNYSLEDFDTLDEIKDRLPADLYQAAKQALSGNAIESLDI